MGASVIDFRGEFVMEEMEMKMVSSLNNKLSGREEERMRTGKGWLYWYWYQKKHCKIRIRMVLLGLES